jgi:hypothetical protein
MAATTAMCTSFKVELLRGVHNFTNGTGDSFKVALIKNSMAGTYGAASTNYSNITGNSDEVANGNGYATGGQAITQVTPTSSGTTAYCDFTDNAWTNSTFTAAACMIYNTTDSNVSVSVHDFGGDKTVSAGTFTLVYPAADATNAILRLA